MPIPSAVRAAVVVWLAAVGAGVAETLVHLTQADPPGALDLGLRGGTYLAVVALVLALGTGRRSVRWALTLLLGGVGTASLLVDPVTWLAGGGSPVAYLASAEPATLAVVALRAAHLGAVVAAVVLMFGPRANEFFRQADRGRRPSPPGTRHPG